MRLQPIENLSKTYSGDPHLGQTKLNGLLLLTIHGVLEDCLRLMLPSMNNLYSTLAGIGRSRTHNP